MYTKFIYLNYTNLSVFNQHPGVYVYIRPKRRFVNFGACDWLKVFGSLEWRDFVYPHFLIRATQKNNSKLRVVYTIWLYTCAVVVLISSCGTFGTPTA